MFLLLLVDCVVRRKKAKKDVRKDYDHSFEEESSVVTVLVLLVTVDTHSFAWTIAAEIGAEIDLAIRFAQFSIVVA